MLGKLELKYASGKLLLNKHFSTALLTFKTLIGFSRIKLMIWVCGKTAWVKLLRGGTLLQRMVEMVLQ